MKNSFDDLWVSVKEYLDLKLDGYKLRGAEGLSALFNTFLSVIVICIVASCALQILGISAGFALGILLGSIPLGLCIIGCIIAAATATMFIFRKKLFVKLFHRIFLRIMFNNPQLKDLNAMKTALEQAMAKKEYDLYIQILIKGYTFVNKTFL